MSGRARAHRDRGKPHGSSPPTPPYVRVLIRLWRIAPPTRVDNAFSAIEDWAEAQRIADSWDPSWLHRECRTVHQSPRGHEQFPLFDRPDPCPHPRFRN